MEVGIGVSLSYLKVLVRGSPKLDPAWSRQHATMAVGKILP